MPSHGREVNPRKKSEKKTPGDIDKHGIKLYNVINAEFSATNITRLL